jgi:hypothetical protein
MSTVTETATNPTDAIPTPQADPIAAPAVEPTPAVPVADPAPTLLGDDPKPEETKPADPPPVPEKYEFKAPEGKEFDAKLVDSFSEAAKKAGLTQDAAQTVIAEMAPVLEARQQEQITTIRKEWLDASTTDKEFGGEKLKENLGVAKKAMDTFATPELRKLLEDTGLGNHPEMIRAFYRAGKAISEDSFVSGHASAKPQDITAVLYPTMKKE